MKVRFKEFVQNMRKISVFYLLFLQSKWLGEATVDILHSTRLRCWNPAFGVTRHQCPCLTSIINPETDLTQDHSHQSDWLLARAG